MFKVNVNGTIFDVSFRYSKEEFGKGRKKYVARYTKCLVNGEEMSKARCSKHDNFCRAIGRKIALQRMLAKLKFTPEVRVDFWTEYFTKLSENKKKE